MLREYLMPSRCRTVSWKLFNILVIASSFTGIISISISRGHYLIDILLAYYVTTRVFWIYHTLANNYSLRVCTYMCVYVYYMYVYVYIVKCMYTYTYLYAYLYVFICVLIHTYMYEYVLIRDILLFVSQTSSQTNYLSRVWWWHLFRYFESIPHERRVVASSRDSSPKQSKSLEYCNCDSGVQTVKRSFEWPLPWPRCLRRASRYRQRLIQTAEA